MFSYPTARQDVKGVTRVIINIMAKHAYKPTTISSGKKSEFVSQVIKEVADVLRINLAP